MLTTKDARDRTRGIMLICNSMYSTFELLLFEVCNGGGLNVQTHLKVAAIYYRSSMYVCMVSTFRRVSINRIWLLILLVVS